MPEATIVIFESERARRALASLGAVHARPPADRWMPVPDAIDRAIAADRPLAAAALLARRDLVRGLAARLAGLVEAPDIARFAGPLLDAPRERFVLPEDIASSAEDVPAPLDPEGLATVSAPHAYVLTYALLGLAEGDHLVEMGTGTGYGASIASRIVGPRGRITSIEIDPDLHERARRILTEPHAHGPAPIILVLGDARDRAIEIVEAHASSPQPIRIAVTYAIADPPEDLLERLPEGGRIVAPVGEDDQRLVRWAREGGALVRASYGAVRYVAERG